MSKPDLIMSDQVMTVDVDDTLVIWGQPDHPKAMAFECYGQRELLVPHEEHIRFLKRQKARGYKIVVWSQGGFQWARHVVERLGLEDDVDLIMCKPLCYMDDLPVESWLKQRIYFKPGHHTHGLNPNDTGDDT